MRKIPRHACALSILWVLVAIVPARAGDYIISQKQTGFTLPGVALPSGQDEIRAADGTSCRSSIANSGAYLDSGVIAGNDEYTAAAYGRVVIPLGRKPKRLDCSRLYELEIQRLQLELEMAKRGLGAGSGTDEANWTSGDEWGYDGRN